MQTKVSELYEAGKSKFRLKLQAGASGLTNSVYWVYLAEDPRNVSFLKGGELAITTGIFTQNGVSLYEFIRSLAMCNCSGIIVNTGQYLHETDITPQIIELCDKNRFPLFVMPWEVHLVDLMQEYCTILLQSNRMEDRLNTAFQTAMYQSPLNENVIRTLNRAGFPTAADYRILTVQNLQNTTRVVMPLNALGFRYHVFEYENMKIIVYLPSEHSNTFENLAEQICYCDSVRLGASDVFHSITELATGYKRARFALAVALARGKSYAGFESLGFLKILFCTSDTKLLWELYQQRLAKLEAYDAEHSGELCDTLKTFLLCDCNLLLTSKQIHTHRNTIIYRVSRIKEILQTSLDSAEEKFNLLAAFYIKEYFSL